MSKKIAKIGLIIAIGIILIIGILYAIDLGRMKNNEPVLFSTWGKNYTAPEENTSLGDHTSEMNVVLSLEDEISPNTAWCGTFNLIWNDLKNDLAKQPIVFTPQPNAVKNLNLGTFTTAHLAEESYYKVYGLPTKALKEEIEKAIKEKFNETSDILDSFDWNNSGPNDYFLYAMLKKQFEFPKVFTKLAKGTFGDKENVDYFGIDASTEEVVRNQVKVIYYDSKQDFAIELTTKTNDQIIISRGSNKNTFLAIYEEIETKKQKGNKALQEGEVVQIPNINIDLKKEFEELQNKPFLFSNGDEYVIEKAMQTIQFELTEKGGKIKSEAGMMVNKTAIIQQDDPRQFMVDGEFTIFLREKDKKLPYFAAKINDISKVQENVTKISGGTNPEEGSSFLAEVIESDLTHIMVKPAEGTKELQSSDKISIQLENDNDMIYPVGTKLNITYSGEIRETYPATIDATNIELAVT
jgi:hypothetical protein